MRYIKHAYNAWYSRDLYCSLSFFHAPSVFPQVMPILKLLYNPDNHNAHHIYMSLIILLILSQDENFNKSVHELVWIKIMLYSPYLSIAPSKGNPRQSWILDYTSWIPDSGLFQWNMDCGFQSLTGFCIPWAVLRTPQAKIFPRILQSTNKNFPDSK